MLEDESVSLPISLPVDPASDEPNKNQVNAYNVSCLRYVNNQVVENMYGRIEIQPSARRLYHVLNLRQLEVGEYKISLNVSMNHSQTIRVIVHAGQYWKENPDFIIKSNSLITKAKQD